MTLHASGTSTSSMAFLLTLRVIDRDPRVATSLSWDELLFFIGVVKYMLTRWLRRHVQGMLVLVGCQLFMTRFIVHEHISMEYRVLLSWL